MAKRQARIAKAKQAHDSVVADAHRTQAHALEIEARAKCRLADEYDAAQERGELDMEGGGSPMAGAASDGKLVSAYAAGTIEYREARAALKRAGIVE